MHKHHEVYYLSVLYWNYALLDVYLEMINNVHFHRVERLKDSILIGKS